jgi:2',3'-cyclic-nucleotide 2'-phosphodiesterase (5'-nucleotidase family)
VANNLYDYDEAALAQGPRLHEPYIIRNVDGVNVALLGITSDSVPHQAQAFNTGFRFTMGFSELPGDIADARADGAAHVPTVLILSLSCQSWV